MYVVNAVHDVNRLVKVQNNAPAEFIFTKINRVKRLFCPPPTPIFVHPHVH